MKIADFYRRLLKGSWPRMMCAWCSGDDAHKYSWCPVALMDTGDYAKFVDVMHGHAPYGRDYCDWCGKDWDKCHCTVHVITIGLADGTLR